MYDDIKKTKTTGFKKLKNISFKHLQKILSIVALGLLLLLVTFFSANTKAATVSIEEIESNSERYNELQTTVNQCADVISKAQKEQEDLSHRNKLLRELFSQGKNQK